jgi:SAM-dependent methyltransferase
MSDLHTCDPLVRFSGLAEMYSRYRPAYPPAALDFILSRCGLGPGSVLADIGCGTGIASRLFAARGLQVIGVEPNADMRSQAESSAAPASGPPPCYRAGRAEDTGLPADCADAVLAAQSFHWFESAAALAEFHRILKPAGWAILLWNERDESDPCTAAYGQVVARSRDAARFEKPRHQAHRPLLESPRFHRGEHVLFANEQLLDEAGLLGRALSVSYAPREPAEAEAFAAALRQVFHRFQHDGQVRLRYQTSVTIAQRA